MLQAEKMTKTTSELLYRPNEFAALAGVTVRTLHHYDRIGLLRPSGYTSAGYRLYRKSDLVRLQQIVTLKFIGLSLKQIKDLLHRNSFDLATALSQQQEILVDKRRHLDRAIKAIEKARQVKVSSEEPDWEDFRKIIEVINMQNNMDWTQKYYSEEARQKLEERRQTISPDVVEKGQRDWANLIREVEEAVAAGTNPASEKAQVLAARWSELIKAFTGGDAEIQAGLNKLYKDQANWPTTFPKPYSDEVGAFICAAGGKK